MARVFIVDIDGTLADLGHRLHFINGEKKDWDAFFEGCDKDLPIKDVIDVIRMIGLAGEIIVYLTGRPERVRGKTLEWLFLQGLPNGIVIMRKDGDHREDTVAKRELMGAIIAGGDKIAGVFEDRPSVCRVWREMGLTVFQVNDKEF